ncbi:hypothetical protein SLK231_14200 [Helicobacter pylori]
MGYNKENLYQILLNANTNGYHKLTQVKNLNFFENKDHTIKLNTIHNGLHIRPLNYVSNLFFNLQRIIGLVSLFGILFSISIYLPYYNDFCNNALYSHLQPYSKKTQCFHR